MQNRKHQSDRESRRQSGKGSYAAEDARRRFQDQSYDNYFPQQDYGSRYSSQQDQAQASRMPYKNWSAGSQEGTGSSERWGYGNYERGPKGFKRSDERIKEEVSEALYRDNSVDASEIEVAVQDGEVTLTGIIANRRMKRLAEDCIENISGVTDIHNEIRVQSPEGRTSSNSDESSGADRTERPDKSKNKNSSYSKLI